jgi:hypothetical protein
MIRKKVATVYSFVSGGAEKRSVFRVYGSPRWVKMTSTPITARGKFRLPKKIDEERRELT